ncbi:multiple sugar transport system substrate-binding protein [Paenibacillus endophyticus]|uniref:Multiple sugar transport system substrate-binding protein n=1 Tax=Paenibacillus endophyticus TaxID=1294268 RepID=A0A7W5C945_9BACL|nr:extracellular solute-binding protein [Paenibacillus endophyticus]MBB3153262.1 multiple sugar transport system substrate-binding protein [Paenibacillus endophyticus]
MIKRVGLTTVWAVLISMAMTACSTGGDEAEIGGKSEVNENGKTVLTLSVMQATPFYTALEKKFEAKHMDIDLQIQAYKQAGEELKPGEWEEYRKSMNTALLSGKGSDVIELLDGLPADEYVEKGLLLNMEDLMNKDDTLKPDNMYMNVLNAIKQKGGTYAIPSEFYLRAFIGDGELLKDAQINEQTWTWQDFAGIAKQLTQGKDGLYAMADYTPDMLMQEMTIDSYSSYVDKTAKKAKFDTPEFVSLLKQVKNMYDEGVMTAEPAERDKQLFYSAVLREPADVVNVTHTTFSHPRLLQKPHSLEQSGMMRIIPSSRFAIRAKTPSQLEAWKLLSYLLSEEGQSMPERSGFSLLKSVNEQKLDEIKKQIQAGTYKLPDGQSIQAADEEFTRFTQLLDLADQYSILDGKVISIVGEESLAFFSGQKSAEEAAGLIQNRAITFLNE